LFAESTQLLELSCSNLDKRLDQSIVYLLWLGVFFTFGTKTALVPVHVWLPWAHGEAPTIGSMILAGILLKLGGYGFIKILLLTLPKISFFFSPFVTALCLLGIVFSSFMVFFQSDIKRLVAYSSITHMGFATASIFSLSQEGLVGGVFTMLGHGVVATALFFCVGTIYERYGTREFVYYNGLVAIMPIYTIFFIIFFISNASFPGTISFVGELLGLVGIFKMNTFVGFFIALALILNTSYSFWAFTRICFGSVNRSVVNFSDVSIRETSVLLILLIVNFWFGFHPSTPVLELLNFYFYKNL